MLVGLETPSYLYWPLKQIKCQIFQLAVVEGSLFFFLFSYGNTSHCHHFSLQVADKASVKYVQQICKAIFAQVFKKKKKMSSTLGYTTEYEEEYCDKEWEKKNILFHVKYL